MKEFALTGEGFQSLMASLLKAGPDYRVKVRGRGYSMVPFIKDKDAVFLQAVDRRQGVSLGDVVAVSGADKRRIVIHRVVRIKNGRYQTKGDNNPRADSWCTIDDIIGIVHKIESSGWVAACYRPWQNAAIAIASKTGLLNRVIYPSLIFFRNLTR